MRKIRLFIASSLDGYIARESGAVDWLFTDCDYGYHQFFDEIDTVIMGRKTYDRIFELSDYPYADKKGFVLSTTLHGQQDKYVEFVGYNLDNFVKNLHSSPGKDIWLIGGSEVIHLFLKQHWVDELILSIHPKILGSGIPLVVNDPNLEMELSLTDVTTFDSGLVQLVYRLEP
jgi:dihydrofolate reductase